MSEHTDDVLTEPRVPSQRIALPLSDAVRASLQAVRTAQEAAQRRARRETRVARLWFAGVVAGIVVGLLVFGPRGRAPRVAGSASVATAPAPAPIGPAAMSERAATSEAPAGAPASPVAPAAGTGAVTSPPVALAAGNLRAAPDAATVAAAESACTASFGQRRWRMSIDTCTRAFEAQPTDASLALRIAQAQHARSRLPEAAEWANRALGLDPSLPEAFVIVAHAESHAGRPSAALDAYRRYLALAPHGWHAGEARAALRVHARAERARLRTRNSLSSAGGTSATPVAAAD